MSFADVLDAKPKEPELYKVLGCDEKSTTEQIVAEYRARVRDAHPDKCTNDSGSTTTDQFVKLQNAYSILTNESRRKTYDSWLHSPFPVTFDEFSKNSDTFQMSTHWVVPKSQPSIGNGDEKIGKNNLKNAEKSPSKWADGERYQSKIASDFRNYKFLLVRRTRDRRPFVHLHLRLFETSATCQQLASVRKEGLLRRLLQGGGDRRASAHFRRALVPHRSRLRVGGTLEKPKKRRMVQGKAKKQKTSLPKGVKPKMKKQKKEGPKKGKFLHIAPRKQHVIEAEKIAAHVTKIINDKNEEMVKGRADTAVGRAKK